MLNKGDIRQLGLPPADLPADSGAIHLDDLPIGAVTEIQTGHTTYMLENRGKGKVLISGHPTYCPEPTLVELRGCTGGPAGIKMWCLEPGSRMVFEHPELGIVRTSRIRAVRQLESAPELHTVS